MVEDRTRAALDRIQAALTRIERLSAQPTAEERRLRAVAEDALSSLDQLIVAVQESDADAVMQEDEHHG